MGFNWITQINMKMAIKIVICMFKHIMKAEHCVFVLLLVTLQCVHFTPRSTQPSIPGVKVGYVYLYWMAGFLCEPSDTPYL